MLILTIRTDKPEAEIGLYDNEMQLTYETWQAHRELSQTIHKKIEALLKSVKKDWHDLEGIVCFKGPGSFTGLRIGLTVGNTLSYSLTVPIVSSHGENWIQSGLERIKGGQNETVAMPEYGADANITQPRK
ncbi:MAG TPA: tRNA (adenosine(37)-N6)-threonylcarbamoyltransferase complex dimerization subunit type 1 TsaB [Candidatus Saccharimonadales bacterium]|nr:tRNA (adenosine(37)-N6)-threonylcarbamoyltransferase complex dimerization subunit type 1 TsaB [Candidatus Saccharimonadales bacterium]